MTLPARSRAVLALALMSLIFGYSWVVTKVALRDSGPFEFAALRTGVGVLCLFLVLVWKRRVRRPERVLQTALLGFLQTSGFLLFSSWALVEGGVGKTAVLVFTMPFWTLLFAWWLLGERIRGFQWVAVVVALLGLLCVLEPWGLRSTLASKALAVLAGISWAASAIVAKRMQARHRIDVLSLTFWQMLWALIPLILVAVLVPERAIVWSGSFWATLLYNGVLTTALGWLLWLYILETLPAGTASLSALAIPVVAIMASAWQLGELPHGAELLGMAFIALALVLLARRQAPRATVR